jgi:hypothetical protein
LTSPEVCSANFRLETFPEKFQQNRRFCFT